jgi:hypothetical protein
MSTPHPVDAAQPLRRLEIVCVTTSVAERDAVIAAVAPFCGELEVEVRVYTHEQHPTDLAVHLTHRDGARADALAEHIAARMEAYGLVSRSRWREVTGGDRLPGGHLREGVSP